MQMPACNRIELSLIGEGRTLGPKISIQLIKGELIRIIYKVFFHF